MCCKRATYIGETVGDNIVGFKSRLNQQIRDYTKGASKCKFPIYGCKCGKVNKCLKNNFLTLAKW